MNYRGKETQRMHLRKPGDQEEVTHRVSCIPGFFRVLLATLRLFASAVKNSCQKNEFPGIWIIERNALAEAAAGQKAMLGGAANLQ
jgi:hypothetical protein